MPYLLLSIAASTSIFIVFRWMKHNGASTRHAIVVNYLVAMFTGILLFHPTITSFSEPWFWPAAIEGLLFYLVFHAMANTAQINGVAAASIATKMSVVIPVSVGLFILHESANEYKLLGIASGLLAVYLCAGKSKGNGNWKWLLMSFFGTGLIDISFKLFQMWTVSESDFPSFITTIFGFAFLCGFAHHMMMSGKRISLVSYGSGTLLGIINFGTVYFFLHALATPSWDSSIIFSINSFGIVLLSTLTGILIFREKLSARGWIGLGLAGMSIWLLFLST